ncbi:hypothetical protein M8J76_014822 [Diaphorina citri]|nr:hypothetical protein M8J76_014822 [Diaphorina citri]
MECIICSDGLNPEDSLRCSVCAGVHHYFCVGQGLKNFKKMSQETKANWKCATCKEKMKVKNIASPPLGSTFTAGNENVHHSTILPEALTKDYLDTKFNQLESKMFEMVENLKKDFKTRMDAMETKLAEKDTIIEDLESRLDDLENRSRISNIEIRGVPETKHEEVKALVQRIGVVIGCGDIQEDDIQVAHRVVTKRAEGPKPIIVHLKSRWLKNKWLAAHKKYKAENNFAPLKASEIHQTFKDVPISMFEHLTAKRKFLLSETRAFAKQANLKYVWTRDAVIFVREAEHAKVRKVSNPKQLEELKNVFKYKVGGAASSNA